jgi:RNA polymerase sigma-70 factor (ECF subfamily)
VWSGVDPQYGNRSDGVKVDANLLNAARAGDPDAMNELLAGLHPDIRRYAAYRCGPATAIDDVVQEAMIIINRRVGTINNLAAFAGWLARVVARLCLLPVLRLIRAADSLARVDNAAAFATRPTVELRMDVAGAIESLPEKYRIVILMRDFEELTIGEMAARLELTRDATKSRLHRARAMLREYLLSGGFRS